MKKGKKPAARKVPARWSHSAEGSVERAREYESADDAAPGHSGRTAAKCAFAAGLRFTGCFAARAIGSLR
jgi:hypothetical protein